tara:strand:+ start:852 stop:1088 length:237 start_codon:yes stop_codon:yes gene_type:complete
MIDTDYVKGKYCSKQEMIFYLNAVEEAKRLREENERLQKAIDGGDTVKQDYQCYRCGLWYDDKDTMKECVEECKEEGR